ncbi:DUF4129 domain-containing protein [Streptomyces sp. YIM 98790]|uniref:DUF4129 domain-containing protein n=1 Tax=Streptomyces sp. YIM 98790 TaxID=2689077 RepID=UPI0014083388|nr:DUF4129 domain-containing protein [Streptomyces sp. YIM 98790]
MAERVIRAAPTTDGDEPPVVIDRDAAREAARDELSDDVYAEHRPGLLRRISDWVYDNLLDPVLTGALSTPGGWLGLLLLGLVVLALLFALRKRLGALKSAASTARPGLLSGPPRSAAQHRAAADAHAEAGRWNEAVQERMRAIVRSQEERALLEPRPGRTADEAADEAARALPALGAPLRAAARTFDDVTYGGVPAGPQDHDRLHRLDEEQRRTRPRQTGAGTAAAGTWAAPHDTGAPAGGAPR